MMKVLLIEDSSFITDVVLSGLSSLGCDVDFVQTIADAYDKWEINQDYDCIIVDLHIDPLGLSKSETNTWFPVFGWLWIKFILKDLSPEEQNKIKEKIIIHSKYIEELESKSKKAERKGFTIIEKEVTDSDTNIEKLLRHVQKVLKK